MFHGPPLAQRIDGSERGDDGFRGIAVRSKISDRDRRVDEPPVAFLPNKRAQLASKASRLTMRSK